MVAGTSTDRTIVASMRMPKNIATPISLMNVTDDVEKAPMTTMRRSAADVMMRPVRCSPVATASRLSPVLSYCSLIRDSRNTSLVHGQPEHDGEHEDRLSGVDRPGRREVQQAREVTVLEDPRHHSNVAAIDRMFIAIALIGTTTDPNARKSSTNVARATMSAIQGSREPRSASRSTTSAV